ncbi:MAG: hypothetical protein GXY37_02940 [Chloroflexi bacterium]|nr:hypothetical protein [Chloroflexota bacterium]
MQADTIVPMSLQGTQAFDRYAYVNNNPVNGTDPSENSANWFGEFIFGFSVEIVRTNNWLGAILFPDEARSLAPSSNESEAMLIGRIVGDLTTTALGILEINTGVGIAGGGAVVGCGTTLCLASAPAAAAGAAVVTLGAVTLLSGAAAFGENIAYFSNRHKNDLRPDPNATGLHSTFKRDPTTGKVTNYETYQPQTNPQNPNPWSKILRFDGIGKAHPESSTNLKILPHIHDFLKNIIRRPSWLEIPR